MRKRVLCSVVLATAICMGLAGCGKKDVQTSPVVNQNDDVTSDIEGMETMGEQVDPTTADHPVNWLCTADFSEAPRDTFEGGLTGFAIEGAIDLEALDSAKYNELLANEETVYGIDDGRVDDGWSVFFDDETKEVIGDSDIFVYNFTQDIGNFQADSRPFGYCLQQGWWCMELGVYNKHEIFLNIDCNRESYLYGEDDRELLDGIIEKFGTPDYFMTEYPEYVDKWKEARNTGMGAAYYDMVYEYQDFVLIIGVTEDIRDVAEEGDEPNYMNNVAVSGCVYYTRECWDLFKETEFKDYVFVPVYETFNNLEESVDNNVEATENSVDMEAEEIAETSSDIEQEEGEYKFIVERTTATGEKAANEYPFNYLGSPFYKPGDKPADVEEKYVTAYGESLWLYGGEKYSYEEIKDTVVSHDIGSLVDVDFWFEPDDLQGGTYEEYLNQNKYYIYGAASDEICIGIDDFGGEYLESDNDIVDIILREMGNPTKVYVADGPTSLSELNKTKQQYLEQEATELYLRWDYEEFIIIMRAGDYAYMDSASIDLVNVYGIGTSKLQEFVAEYPEFIFE